MRAAWEDNIAALRAGLNFEDEFTAAGSDWVEALPDGVVNAPLRHHGEAEPRSPPEP